MGFSSLSISTFDADCATTASKPSRASSFVVSEKEEARLVDVFSNIQIQEDVSIRDFLSEFGAGSGSGLGESPFK